MVYDPSANGQLRKLQEQAGGKLLSDFSKPTMSSVIDFSKKMIDTTVKNGNYVHFDLTYVNDIKGVLNNTGQYANTVTAQELRYIKSNWSTFKNNIKFYNNGIEAYIPFRFNYLTVLF